MFLKHLDTHSHPLHPHPHPHPPHPHPHPHRPSPSPYLPTLTIIPLLYSCVDHLHDVVYTGNDSLCNTMHSRFVKNVHTPHPTTIIIPLTSYMFSSPLFPYIPPTLSVYVTHLSLAPLFLFHFPTDVWQHTFDGCSK